MDNTFLNDPAIEVIIQDFYHRHEPIIQGFIIVRRSFPQKGSNIWAKIINLCLKKCVDITKHDFGMK